MTPLNVDMLKGDFRILAIKSFLEKATAFVRGKGQKTLSIIDVLIDVPEDQIPRSVSSCALEAPKMVALMKGDQFEMAVIKSDNSLIYCQTCDILEAILVLFGSYYCFQLMYPRCYRQLSAVLQQVVLGEPYIGEKSTNCKHFRNKM